MKECVESIVCAENINKINRLREEEITKVDRDDNEDIDQRIETTGPSESERPRGWEREGDRESEGRTRERKMRCSTRLDEPGDVIPTRMKKEINEPINSKERSKEEFYR
jgi:hypothetical protein